MAEETTSQTSQASEASRLVEEREEYKWGFVTDIESDVVPPGLNEDVIRLISAKKNEPEFLLEWRLQLDEVPLGDAVVFQSSIHFALPLLPLRERFRRQV